MELVSRAIEFLHARGSATSAELASHVFGGEAFVPLLGSLRDERLLFDRGHWRLRPPVDLLAILEVLTTGPNPRRHRIVEVAAQRGSARFHKLISSPKPVPKLLRKLGVPECVPEGAHAAAGEWLPLEQASADLRDFLGGATVAGFGYLPEFLEQLLGAQWPAIDLLCLVRWHGFGGRPDPITLSRHFGLKPPLSRRPASMLSFSSSLLQRLQAGRSIEELRLLGEPQTATTPEHKCLAEEPGVYVMASAEGEPLYVGKSANLRRRVGSYLRSPIAISRNLHNLMALTNRIDVVPVDSELEAAILEKQLIDEWLPPFNTQRRWGKPALYLRLSSHEPFPRLTQAAAPQPDGATYFGPFRHATAAVRLRLLLASVLRLRTCTRQLPAGRKPRAPCAKAGNAECLAPCIAGPPPEPYSREVELVKQLLSESPDQFRDLLRRLLRQRPPPVTRARKLKRQLQVLAPANTKNPLARRSGRGRG